MTNAKHTPAPWYPSNEMIMAKNGDVSVADCFGNMKGHLPLTERQANARLIAAAPELLEALQRILRAHDSGNNGAYMGEAVLCKMLANQACAAIAKAEDK